MQKAEHDRPNLLSKTIYIGTLELVIVLPVIAGAYLRSWLDGMMAAEYAYPPILNLDAAEFYTDLISHYLFAVLHEFFIFL
jgi:hypothetical protein